MDGASLNIYVEISGEDIFPTVDWFLTAFLPESGYGADKSIGMGNLMIERDKSFDSSAFLTQGANARMAISFSSFIGMEGIDAFYRLKTKFGKLVFRFIKLFALNNSKVKFFTSVNNRDVIEFFYAL